MLFNPNTPEVPNKSAVQAIQQTYRELMKEYANFVACLIVRLKATIIDKLTFFSVLILNYGEQDARRAYSHLISQANALADWVRNYGADVIFELSPYSLDLVYIDVVGM